VGDPAASGAAQQWVEGVPLLLDDSFEHEVWTVHTAAGAGSSDGGDCIARGTGSGGRGGDTVCRSDNVAVGDDSSPTECIYASCSKQGGEEKSEKGFSTPSGFDENGGARAEVYAREKDANQIELETKLKLHVTEKYGGDFENAFAGFDKDSDGSLNKGELKFALKAVGIGNGFTRGAWMRGIMKKMDVDPTDGKLTFEELLGGAAAECGRGGDEFALTPAEGFNENTMAVEKKGKKKRMVASNASPLLASVVEPNTGLRVTRVVLIVDVWHPDLSTAHRSMLGG
jgi:hypothetical protein